MGHKSTCTLLLFSALLFVQCQDVTFPTSITLKNMNLQWDSSNPSFDAYVYTQTLPISKVARFSFTGLREIHYTSDPKMTYISPLLTNPNTSTVVTNLTFDDNDFSSRPLAVPNLVGVQFNKTLFENTPFFINFTTNPVNTTSYKIPRKSDNADCSRSGIAFQNFNCSCDEYYVVQKNRTVKVAMNVTNWAWKELAPNRTARALAFDMEITGDINYLYYLDYILANGGDILSSGVFDGSVCDSMGIKLNFSNGDIILPFGLFTHGVLDNEIKLIYLSVGIKVVRFTQLALVFSFYFDEFNTSLVYDPDLSVLFRGGTGDEEGDEQAEDPVGKDSSDIGDDTALTVGLAVGLSMFGVVVIVAIVVLVLVFVKKRKLRRIFSTMATIQTE